MAVYLGYLLLAGAQILLFYRKDKFGERYFDSKKYLALCCLELIFLAGLRGYKVGADTEVYLKAITHYENIGFPEILTAPLVYPFDFEIGYFWLTKICAFLKLGKTGFLFVVAIITYVPVFVAINKHSKFPYISILCYFAFGMFSYSLGLFRQMIAISIIFCGRDFLEGRKPLKYFLTVAVAMLFHTTAAIALPLYLLYTLDWKKLILSIVGVEALLVMLGRPIVMLAVNLFPKYKGYIGGKFDQQGGSYLMLIFLNLVLFACVIVGEKKKDHDKLSICALMLACCLQAIGYSMAIFGRIVPYFSIYIIFAIPDIIGKLEKKLKVAVGVVTVGVLFLLAYRGFSTNTYVTPYTTAFWDFSI